MFTDFSQAKELIYILAWKDIVSRYKQSAFGILWILVRPFTMMVLLTFIFKGVSKLDSGSIPYPLFVFSGLYCFELFSILTTRISGSVLANRTLVNRVKCNRLLFPISALLVTVAELALLTLALIGLLIFYGVTLTLNMFAIMLAIILVSLIAFGFGLVLAALSVWYRDIKFAITYFLQVLLFLSPVGYATSNFNDGLAHFLIYNPLTSAIDLARWALFGQEIAIDRIGGVFLVHVCLMFVAVFIFQKLSRDFADVI